jgi:hypothetical protein
VLANNLGFGGEYVPKLVEMMAQINNIRDDGKSQ